MQVTAAYLVLVDTGSRVDEETMTACNQTENSRLLQALKTEIGFFDAGGYGQIFRSQWRPTLLLRDSPACANYSDSGRQNPCSRCPMFSLVPHDKKDKLVPCHFIPLDKCGRTIAWFYEHGSQESLDWHYRIWLEDITNALKTSS
jgi:hypothetical protein